jgi:integrase
LPLGNCDSRALARAAHRRVAAAEAAVAGPIDRPTIARLQKSVWRDAGAIRSDRVRSSFIQTAGAAGLGEISCPKSWRHTFATLLLEVNVDPLIRQLALGHTPAYGSGALGMTTVYSHCRPEIQRREIERALRLWPAALELARQRCAQLETQSSRDQRSPHEAKTT